jgi:hypothetical protein
MSLQFTLASLRANARRKAPPDDRLREAIQRRRGKTEPMDGFIASLHAMTAVFVVIY